MSQPPQVPQPQPYSQPYSQPYPGPPFPAPAPVKKSTNTLGLVALGMAVLGTILSCVHGIMILGWLLLPISFVLGMVAVFSKDKVRWPAVVAIIVSIVGTLVAVIMFVVVVSNAVDDALSSTQPSVGAAPGGTSSDSQEGAAQDGAQGRTRDNPVPLGTEVTGTDWKVVVNSVTFDATDQVLAANDLNEAPAAGQEYVLVNYTVTYIGDDPSGQSPAFVSVDYVTPDGVTINRADNESLVLAPDSIDSLTTLYNGASVTGNIVLSVPSASAQDGVLAVQPDLIGDKVFVAVK